MSDQGIIYNIQRMSVHDGPGIRTTVFFKGCPLSCRWCSNPESQAFAPQLMVFESLCSGCGTCDRVCPHDAIIRNGELRNRDMERCADCGQCAKACPTKARAMSGSAYTVDQVMDIVRKDAGFYRNSGGGVTFGGGECTSQGEFLLSLLESCRSNGLHTCVDTCGCCSPEFFKKLIPLTDLFLYDVKHMDPARHKSLTGADNKLILSNLRTALETAPHKVQIRMPLIPYINDSDENIQSMAAFLKEFGCATMDVMPHHFFGRNKHLSLNRPVPAFAEYSTEELQEVLARFNRFGMAAAVV